MYGLIGKMRAQPGQRDALFAILAEGTAALPGCLSYVIPRDASHPDALESSRCAQRLPESSISSNDDSQSVSY